MIWVWVRRTVEWADEAAFRAQLGANMRGRVELWDRTFDMPYHLFRHRVREIARRNLADAKGVTVAEWDEIPDGAVVVPIDDDDWLAPGIGPALEPQVEDRILGWRWRASFVEVPRGLGHRVYLWRRRLMPWSAERWLCSTNNYALRKGEGTRELFESHVKASTRFLGWRSQGSLWAEDRALSVMNRNLASQTTLRWLGRPISRRELLRKHRAYLRLYDRRLAPELAWARPYVKMMGELMEELSVRRS